MSVIKRFGIDFHSEGGALTLEAHEVTDDVDNINMGEEQTRSHPDGWTITGMVSEGFFCWVNKFSAKHPFYGSVSGDFEEKVVATSEEGFQDFIKNHPPVAWDYENI